MLTTHSLPPVLTELRAGTADLHKNIEAVMPFFKDSFNLDQYRHSLKKFYGFHVAFENRVVHQLTNNPTDFFYEERRKLSALKKDLSFFYSDRDIAQLPICENLPGYDNLAALFGGLYVMEGSTLGGQVITAHLKKIGIDENTCHYFSGYGPNTGKMWKQFQSELAKQAQSPNEIAECVKAARETFLSLHRWME
jgi:heme oxygenase